MLNNRILVNGQYRDMTPAEVRAIEAKYARYELMEKSRPFAAGEVMAMLITAQVNTLSVDDNTALRMKSFYPEWEVDTDYTKEKNRPVGYKVRYNGELWKLRSEHKSQTGWEPGAIGTESLWEQINETHSGTIDDPVPYNGNMALKNGLHYHQNGVVYLCNRDTVNPVYNSLTELVGLYVVEVPGTF
jgi:hypothetical protein